MQSWKGRKKERDVIKNDAFGEVNRVTFEYSRCLKGVKYGTFYKFRVLRIHRYFTPVVRACHHRDAKGWKMASLSQELAYLKMEAHASDGEPERQ